jgi:hypothetical protein
MPNQTLPPGILSAALQGLEAQRQRIESQIAEIRRLIGAGAVLPAAKERPSLRPRRRIGAAARKRIKEGQKKRWEAYHKAQEAAPAKSALVTKAPEKRRLSTAGRKAIAAAARKRWAAVRKQKAATTKSTVPPPAAVVKRAASKKTATKKTAVKAGPAKPSKAKMKTRTPPAKTAAKKTVARMPPTLAPDQGTTVPE